MEPREKAEAILAAARARLALSHGLFAGVVLRKQWQATDECPTIGTDGGGCLYYNPAYIAQCSIPEVEALLVHEACHDLGLHSFRLGRRDALLWNIACDAAINPIVAEAGLCLPPDGVPGIPNSTAEMNYRELEKRPKKKVRCTCQLRPPTGSKSTQAQAEMEAKIQVAALIERARTAGTLSANLARLVGAALEERVPWEQLVSRFVTDKAKMESTWRRPNRRYLAQGIVLPSMWSPEVPDFVWACDTSGSIDEATWRSVCGEALHALATCQRRGKAELQVAWCDTEVSAQVVSAPSELVPKGGGGTDYAPVFRWVAEHAPYTKGVIYVTDGCCNSFGEEPRCPVLWVLTAPNEGFKPPFGEVAYVL